MTRRFFKRILTTPLVVLAAVVLFVEEWLWDKVTAATARLGRLPIVHWIEGRLAKLPPYGALAILLLPGLMLLPVKFAALYFIAKGRAFTGLCIIIGAKVLGTAVAARMFAVCHDSLMSIGWLKRLCDWFLAVKAKVYAKFRSMAAWQMMLRWKQAIKLKLASLRRGGGLGRRWLAAKRLMRKNRAPETVVELAETGPSSEIPHKQP